MENQTLTGNMSLINQSLEQSGQVNQLSNRLNALAQDTSIIDRASRGMEGRSERNLASVNRQTDRYLGSLTPAQQQSLSRQVDMNTALSNTGDMAMAREMQKQVNTAARGQLLSLANTMQNEGMQVHSSIADRHARLYNAYLGAHNAWNQVQMQKAANERDETSSILGLAGAGIGFVASGFNPVGASVGAGIGSTIGTLF